MYNRENYLKIRRIYDEKNLNAKKAAEARADELHAKYPELAKIDRVLSETGLQILAESMNGREGLEERINALREQNAELLKARGEYLLSLGYPADYTAVRYECSDCQDTGFIGTKMCHCLHRDLVLAGYESSGIGRLIDKQRFETFSLSYYNATPAEHENMERIFSLCREYADTFVPEKSKNLLFCGTTGLGKTHLSTSIAKVVIEKGNDVVYVTAQDLLSDFEFERFNRSYNDSDPSRTEKYGECDLLIVDDLGTEMANQFSLSCLYNVINTRLNRGQAMIFNTNLTQSQLRDRYGDRITSRLFGEFLVLQFTGKDIRLQKVMS